MFLNFSIKMMMCGRLGTGDIDSVYFSLIVKRMTCFNMANLISEKSVDHNKLCFAFPSRNFPTFRSRNLFVCFATDLPRSFRHCFTVRKVDNYCV